MIATTGEAAVKSIRIKIFTPGNKLSKVFTHRAPAKKCFTDKTIDKIIMHTANRIEKKWPNEEYKMVALAGNQYNFIHVGSKKEENNG